MPERRADALQRLRSAHERAVLDELRRSGALTRADLVSRVGLSRTTLSAIVADLLAREVLVERRTASEGLGASAPDTEGQAAGPPAPGPEPLRGRGRPATTVSLNPRGAALVGIGMLVDRLEIVVANHAHQFVAGASRTWSPDLGPDERLAEVMEATQEVRRSGISLAAVEAVGLGLPGPVRDLTGQGDLAAAPAVTHLTTDLERHFGAVVRTDNNTRLAALAEVTWGSARGLSDILYLRWSHGVGGGIVIGGRLVRGAHGAAGEIGHTSRDPRGPACYCGGRGCLEGQAALPALLAACRDRGVHPRDTGELLALAAAGQPAVTQVLDEAAAAVGQVLAALAAQTDPACVVVAGEPAGLDGVLRVIRRQLDALSLPTARPRIPVRSSALGDDAAAQGAVAMLLREFGQAPDPLALPSPATGAAARTGAPA
ncbi:ROK family protein [Streptomyces sp. YPW6]|uniref:ROK family protein n=1 Tax=Streptomyces sp. YPW6 TaxID=2840373 RepID=UPI003D710858